MKGPFFLFALLALFCLVVSAQNTATRAATTSVSSIINPETQSTGFPSSSSNEIDNTDSSEETPSQAGADGPDAGSFKLSKEGMIAIIVVVVVVAVGGSESCPLPYL